MTLHHILRAALCLAVQFANASGPKADDFAIRDGDTVVFLGDSITATRGYGKIIENYTLLRYPDRKVRFINVGIGGDTAAGGLKRLQRDVFDNNATLLTVAFGVNDIGWGMYADDEHRQQYLNSIHGIVKACKEKGVRVYICSAAVTGGHPDKTQNDYLQKMCDDGLAIAKEEGGQTIDVQRGMRDILRKVLKANETLPKEKHHALHRDDTIHLTELGELAMAWTILKGLGAPSDVSSCVIDAKSGDVAEADGCTVSDVEAADDSLAFTRIDEGLPFNNGIFATVRYQFVPMNRLNRYRIAVKNLRPGKYQLSVSGRDIGSYRSAQLAQGIDIASATASVWQPGGPWDAQATALRSITDARHELYKARQYLAGYVPDSEIVSPLTAQTDQENEHLEKMQRLIASPQAYRFVLHRQEDAIVVSSPLNYQVFQRSSRTQGRVVVSGSTRRDADQIQFRCQGIALEDSLPTGWQSVPINGEDGSFEHAIDFPAGGWFSMDIRLTKGGKTVEKHSVAHFGVGEVFVGAGQSNSTNSGEFKTKQSSGMVASFSGEHWQIADDPQPGVADKSRGGSYYPAFGDALYEKYGVPIGIAATGFGGTSVNAWQPKDDGLFAWMMTRIDQLGSHGFRAVLWHQGESDVGMSSEEYYDKLKRVIETSRSGAGWDVSWFVAQVSYLNPNRPSTDTTRTAQAKLWADGIALEGPNTDTLRGDHRDHGGAGVHFSRKGLKAHGLLWAEKVQPFIDRMLQ